MSGPNKHLRWHLYNKFHSAPTPGHSVGKVEDCWMCQQFEAAVEAWLEVRDSPELAALRKIAGIDPKRLQPTLAIDLARQFLGRK